MPGWLSQLGIPLTLDFSSSQVMISQGHELELHVRLCAPWGVYLMILSPPFSLPLPQLTHSWINKSLKNKNNKLTVLLQISKDFRIQHYSMPNSTFYMLVFYRNEEDKGFQRL